ESNMQEIASLLKPAAPVRSATVRDSSYIHIEMTAGTGADCDRCKKLHAHSCIRKLVPDSPELPHFHTRSQRNPNLMVHARNVRSNNDSRLAEVFNDWFGWTIRVHHHKIRMGIDRLWHSSHRLIGELLPV